MKKKRSASPAVPILWFCTSALWCVTLGLNIFSTAKDGWLIAIDLLCIAASLAAAVASLFRYRQTKEEDNASE